MMRQNESGDMLCEVQRTLPYRYSNLRIMSTLGIYLVDLFGNKIQLLDQNGMMILSMRSGTMVQSGEHAGCIGCHENRLGAPPPTGRRATGAPPAARH